MMRTLRFSFALLLLAAMYTPAESSAQTVIGVKGGIGISNVSFDSDESLDSRTAFVGGAFATIGIGDVLFVQPEVLYSMKGAKFDDEILGTANAEATWKLDYLEIPILLGTEFHFEDSPIAPRVFAGPSVAFELGCKMEGTEGGVSVSIDCDDFDQLIGFDLDTKSVDFGLVFGAGIGFNLDSFSLIVDGRYVLGLTNLNDIAGTSGSMKNRAWQFMVGAGFPLGG